jgi:hypothetical protein
MAILGSNFLNGCNSISSFIAAGSKMIFENPTAPISWTKDATHNNKTLRIINGATLSPGGSTSFTSVFTGSRAVQGSIAQNATGLTVNSAPALVAVGAAPAQVTFDALTLTLAQIPSHGHSYSRRSGTRQTNQVFGQPAVYPIAASTPYTSRSTDSAGSGQSHTHGITNPQHPHPVTNPNHPHGVSDPQHNHTFTGTAQDFAVLYVDVIVATKN